MPFDAGRAMHDLFHCQVPNGELSLLEVDRRRLEEMIRTCSQEQETLTLPSVT